MMPKNLQYFPYEYQNKHLANLQPVQKEQQKSAKKANYDFKHTLGFNKNRMLFWQIYWLTIG